LRSLVEEMKLAGEEREGAHPWRCVVAWGQGGSAMGDGPEGGR